MTELEPPVVSIFREGRRPPESIDQARIAAWKADTAAKLEEVLEPHLSRHAYLLDGRGFHARGPELSRRWSANAKSFNLLADEMRAYQRVGSSVAWRAPLGSVCRNNLQRDPAMAEDSSARLMRAIGAELCAASNAGAHVGRCARARDARAFGARAAGGRLGYIGRTVGTGVCKGISQRPSMPHCPLCRTSRLRRRRAPVGAQELAAIAHEKWYRSAAGNRIFAQRLAAAVLRGAADAAIVR